MPSRYSGCWELLYDWETLLTGLFALAAGGLAYCIGRRQVRAVENQSKGFRDAEERNLANDTRIAARLFEGLLINIANNIDDTKKMVVDAPRPPDIFGGTYKPRQNLASPPLYEVTRELGNLDP